MGKKPTIGNKPLTSRRLKKELAEFYQIIRLKKELAIFYKEVNRSWKKRGMSKCQLAIAISAICDRKKTDMVKVLETLQEIAIEEVMNKGHFTIPRIVKIKAKIDHENVKSKGQFTIPGIEKIETTTQGSLRNAKAFAIWSLEHYAEQET